MQFAFARRFRPRAGHLAVAVLLGVLALAAPSAAQSAPPLLETGLYDPNASAGGPGGVGYASESLAYSRSYRVGARVVRIPVFWGRLVSREKRPAGWAGSGAARNPLDPNYDFTELDRQVATAVANHLKPLLVLQSAPRWAEQGSYGNYREGVNNPRPSDFGDFATAVAARYSGTLLNLPRVSLFEAWNEPNNEFFFRPQFGGGQPVSPDLYRELVNSMAAAVKGVHADNLVVAGGSSPFGRAGTVAPLVFMQKLLCLSPANRVVCGATTRFDIWAHHPYTSGGPTHRSSKQRPGDVQIGDLPRMRRTLRAARAGGRIVTERSNVAFWVTEFSWDTSPPDRKGVPSARHARWVSEALYRMWRSGVSLVTWTQLRDYPFPAFAYQAGFYRWDPGTDQFNKPKLSLTAFRFPFVAFRRRGGITVWGRTPTSQRVPVVIQRKTSRGWVRVARVSPNVHGLFNRRISTRRTKGTVRARWVAGGQSSVPFTLRVRTADVFVSPLGCGGGVPCR